VKPDGKYLAMNVELERKSVWSFLSFLRQAQALLPELQESKGIVGYSGDAQLLFGKTGRFLSVWESEKDMYKFAHAPAHAKAMVKFKPATNKFKLVKWEITGSDIPKNWKTALTEIPASKVPEK
jgi:hypothetical protein